MLIQQPTISSMAFGPTIEELDIFYSTLVHLTLKSDPNVKKLPMQATNYNKVLQMVKSTLLNDDQITIKRMLQWHYNETKMNNLKYAITCLNKINTIIERYGGQAVLFGSILDFCGTDVNNPMESYNTTLRRNDELPYDVNLLIDKYVHFNTNIKPTAQKRGTDVDIWLHFTDIRCSIPKIRHNIVLKICNHLNFKIETNGVSEKYLFTETTDEKMICITIVPIAEESTNLPIDLVFCMDKTFYDTTLKSDTASSLYLRTENNQLCIRSVFNMDPLLILLESAYGINRWNVIWTRFILDRNLGYGNLHTVKRQIRGKDRIEKIEFRWKYFIDSLDMTNASIHSMVDCPFLCDLLIMLGCCRNPDTQTLLKPYKKENLQEESKEN